MSILLAGAGLAQSSGGVAPAALVTSTNPFYGDRPSELQTRNSPAGSSSQTGSQLLFLLDAGFDPFLATAQAVHVDGFNPNNTVYQNYLLTSTPFTNYVSVTNTNRTDAVTVQFAYYNQDLVKFLDFLVVLSCNDTMTIDAFDYTIPGTAVKVRDVLLGTRPYTAPGITSMTFGSGRFLLSVTAVGAAGNDSGQGTDTSPVGDRGDFDDPEDLDVLADWLFPAELAPPSLTSDCASVQANSIGLTAGVGNDNLNVFNATAISFNYLDGFHVLRRDATTGAAAVRAWIRPAVNLSFDLDAEDTSENPDQSPDFSPQDVAGDEPNGGTPFPSKAPNGSFDAFDAYNIIDQGMDGDGPAAPDHVLLSGSEEIWLTVMPNAALVLPANFFYLRHEAHGGTMLETNCEGFTGDSLRCDATNAFAGEAAEQGALGWTLFPRGSSPSQFIYWLSAKDDYNGSNLAASGSLTEPPLAFHPQVGLLAPLGSARNTSYNLNWATTIYQLNFYNNNEDELAYSFDPRIAVRGLRVFALQNQAIAAPDMVGPNAVDVVFSRDLGLFGLDGLLSLDGGVGTIDGFYAAPVAVNDELGAGWVRFNRVVTRDFSYDATAASLSSFIPYDGERGSYVTIAKEHIVLDTTEFSSFLGRPAADTITPLYPLSEEGAGTNRWIRRAPSREVGQRVRQSSRGGN